MASAGSAGPPPTLRSAQPAEQVGAVRAQLRRSCVPGLPRGIGPELVSAASDNDPTNVGTAAAVEAQTGYRLPWVALLVWLVPTGLRRPPLRPGPRPVPGP